jgi:hypothetical protein
MGSPRVDRRLNLDEERVLRHMLSAWPEGASYVGRLGSLRVVGSCSCGCVTVDLEDEQRGDPNHPSIPLPVEAEIRSEAGEYIGGVLLFANIGFLTTLEAYSVADKPITAWPPNDRLVVKFQGE